MFEPSLSGDRAQVVQHCCADTLLLIVVSNHEGDFGFVRPSDPIPRPGDNHHSKIMSDKPDEGHLIDKIAIPERRKFFIGQVMLRPKESIKE